MEKKPRPDHGQTRYVIKNFSRLRIILFDANNLSENDLN